MRDFPETIALANEFGLYPNWLAALLTFSAVFFDTDAPGVKTRETAA